MRGDEGKDFEGCDPIDAVIDAALRSYAEPTEVPQDRVFLARVMERARKAESSRNRLWVWCWAAAAAVVMLMVAMGSWWVMRSPHAPEIAWTPRPPAVVKPGLSSSGKSMRSFTPQTRHRTPGSRTAMDDSSWGSRTELPKLEVFPAPRPLSPQEQALAAFVQHGPPAAQHAVFEDQQHWDDPIIVAVLQKQSLRADKQQDQ